MTSLIGETVSGLNDFISEQKKEPGEANLTIVFFNDKVQTLYEGNLQDAPEITYHNYVPSSYTALLDAVGSTVDAVGDRLAATPESERPDNVTVVILTDGAENASSDYKVEQINEKIKHQQDVYNWNFIFLAANQDAFAAGAAYGVNPAYTQMWAATSAGTQDAYAYAITTTRNLRNASSKG